MTGNLTEMRVGNFDKEMKAVAANMFSKNFFLKLFSKNISLTYVLELVGRAILEGSAAGSATATTHNL
jgi:hypothetical protein